MVRARAVFFDVDFTLIYPGPRFQGTGYQESCARHGVSADPALFDHAVAGAAGHLDSVDQLYDKKLFIHYTQRIIELMGGAGPAVEAVAREMYVEWAEHRHFTLYQDVPDTLAALSASGLRLGLISNSHRCLVSFQEHFNLRGLIDVAVSSSTHGFLKPHPSIFRAALDEMRVGPAEAVMVGDSLTHDIRGALDVGMSGVWLARGGRAGTGDVGVPVIETLRELPQLLTQPGRD